MEVRETEDRVLNTCRFPIGARPQHQAAIWDVKRVTSGGWLEDAGRLVESPTGDLWLVSYRPCPTVVDALRHVLELQRRDATATTGTRATGGRLRRGLTRPEEIIRRVKRWAIQSRGKGH